MNVGEVLLGGQVAVLLVGFAYAAASDLKEREVTDTLWQVMGIVGVGLGAATVGPDGVAPLALWLLVGAFVLEHLFPWDDLLGPDGDRYADLLEIVVYALVVLIVGLAVWRLGIGADAVPITVVAVLVTVLFARALFELGVLYGGADAKAVMIAGVLLPIFATPWILPASVRAVLAVVPFSVNLLMDAALLSLAIPIGLAIRNAARREFDFPRGFTGYWLDVRELPSRFVWVKDPSVPTSSPDDAETSEDDRRERERIAAELEAKGVRRVWVTPQVPFLVLLAAGAVAALLAGNLVLDVIAWV